MTVAAVRSLSIASSWAQRAGWLARMKPIDVIGKESACGIEAGRTAFREAAIVDEAIFDGVLEIVFCVARHDCQTKLIEEFSKPSSVGPLRSL